MKLRPYQKENSQQLTDILKKEKSVLYQLPTGGGKTVVIEDIIDKIVQGKLTHLGSKIIVLVHRREIIFQIKERLSKQGFKPGVLIGNFEENLDSDILIASILTVTRDARLENLLSKNFDFMIIDEAHHTRSKSYDKVISSFKKHNPNYKLLGVTATPYRKDKKDLKDHFSNLVLGPSISELQELGYLCKVKTYLTNLPDIDEEVSKSAGDYNITELSKFMRDPKIIEHAVNSYERLGNGKQMLSFCVDKKHAVAVKNAYIERGYTKIAHIDSDTKTEVRDKIIEDFRKGELDIITSIQTLTEGTDLPETQILQYLRPTLSLVLYLQMGGRGLRPKADGSDLIVLDIANCSKEHGLLSTNREWNLDNTDPNIKTKRNKIVGRRGDNSVTDDFTEIEEGDLELLELSPEEAFLRKSNGLEEATKENEVIIDKANKIYDEIVKYLNEEFKVKGFIFEYDHYDREDKRDSFYNLNEIEFNEVIPKEKHHKEIFKIEFAENLKTLKLSKIFYIYNSATKEDLKSEFYYYQLMGDFSKLVTKNNVNKFLLKSWNSLFALKEQMVNLNKIEEQIKDFKHNQIELKLAELFAKNIYEVNLKTPFNVGAHTRDYHGSCSKISFLDNPKKLRVTNKVFLTGGTNYYSFGRSYRDNNDSSGVEISSFKKESLLSILLDNF